MLSRWFTFWRGFRTRKSESEAPGYGRAIICDVDETVCAGDGSAIPIACDVLGRLDRAIQVHYVTARPESSRLATVDFLERHKLPGRRNLHLCPDWRPSQQHKNEVMKRLARDWQVLVSIGDADEDEHAARAAGIPFVRVGMEPVEPAWKEIALMLGVPPAHSGRVRARCVRRTR